MRWSRKHMLARALARDDAWDGRFFTGVVSTGIYCLPSCPARKPLPRNVSFFATVAEARAAGLRPCRRCRPDDFVAGHDPGLAALERLHDRLAADPGSFRGAGALQEAAGVGATWLHRLCRSHFHASPGELLQRSRVARACHLLLTGDDSVLDVALTVGYESPSSFHAVFRRRTGLSPAGYRRLGHDPSFAIRLPAGYRADFLLRFHGRDPESPTERVGQRSLHRAMALPGGPVVVAVELAGGAARVSLEAARRRLAPQEVGAVHRAVLRLLGLHAEPGPFERLARGQDGLGAVVASQRGLRIPQTADAFEALVWAILGQQVTLGLAYRMRQRLLATCGVPAGDGLFAHPAAQRVADLDASHLGRLGLSRRKAQTLLAAAAAVASGEIPLQRWADGSATRLERALLRLPGVGPWTAAYVLLRGCGFVDCVPVGDAGLAASLREVHGLAQRPDADATRRLLAPCAPWRSFATTHLWTRLGGPA